MAKGGITATGALAPDLEAASGDRLKDAKTLAAAGRAASAIVFGLYSLEMHLKALICKRLDLPGLPRAFEIHDLEALLVLSGLSRRMDDPANGPTKMNWDNILFFAASLNDLRYLPEGSNGLPVGSQTQRDADDFLRLLEDPTHGVLTWLSNQP